MAQRESVARIEASLPMDGQECAISGPLARSNRRGTCCRESGPRLLLKVLFLRPRGYLALCATKAVCTIGAVFVVVSVMVGVIENSTKRVIHATWP